MTQLPTATQALSLEHRMSRLERQNRPYRAGLGLVLLAGIAAIVWGHAQPIPDVIQARSFVVVDEQGNDAMWLGSHEHGGLIGVFNKQGKMVVGLGSNDEGGRRSL